MVVRLGARGSLVGVSGQESYDGPETVGWERPPAFSARGDVEGFLAARPDVILVRPQHLGSAAGLFRYLQGRGVRVWSRQVLHAGDLYDYWLELGEICGKPNEARALAADFGAAMAPFWERARERPRRPGVFLESIHKDVKTFTPDSIPVWVVTSAGGRDVADDARPARKGAIIADYGPERLLAKAPEVEVLLSQEGPMNRVPLGAVAGRDIYRVLPAVRDGRVHKVPEELISRPTPSLVEGVALVEGLLFPGGGGPGP
jgi:iron complex transport system substrate-binding protein